MCRSQSSPSWGLRAVTRPWNPHSSFVCLLHLAFGIQLKQFGHQRLCSLFQNPQSQGQLSLPIFVPASWLLLWVPITNQIYSLGGLMPQTFIIYWQTSTASYYYQMSWHSNGEGRSKHTTEKLLFSWGLNEWECYVASFWAVKNWLEDTNPLKLTKVLSNAR